MSNDTDNEADEDKNRSEQETGPTRRDERLPADDKKDSDDMDIMDNTECKFNVNSFKMVYVVNSESYLYKRLALQRAKEVCSRLVCPHNGTYHNAPLAMCLRQWYW